ncbi:MAG: DNA gyrase subunit A [Candidatus Falkowbacteria bacterium]|nr:DNA gyrase subunit A [Candidatus Falkowbacteria bacterium]
MAKEKKTIKKDKPESRGKKADKEEIEINGEEQEEETAPSGEHKIQLVTERQKTIYGLVEPLSISEEMKKSYLDYAMSVIVQRALPDVRDGLKPVHRRILYAMWSIGLKSAVKFRKSATVVGEVLGKYHPHGDVAVYDSMVRMVQEFSMRYPLVRGQGNFGSVDGDSAAAMRYTEAKMSAIAEELLYDIDKDTVNFIPNFDGSQKEPTVMPARLPNLLLNGTMGIAVGMSTNIPPHNLGELVDAINYLIDNPDATTEDLMQFVKGPDFPTGGVIYNSKDISQTYATGKGGIVVRGRAEINESKSGNFRIIITAIPYQVNKSTLVEKIAELIKAKKIDGVKDLRDESDRDGIRVVLDLKKDAYPKKILNSLYKHTQFQAIAILEMKLATLANLERLKIETELKEKQKLIKELEGTLKSEAKIKTIIKDEISKLKEKYNDERQTQVISHGVKEFSVEDLVPNEEAVVFMTRDGYIKRMTPDTFKTQGRGGKGVIGLTTKEEDMVEFMFMTTTHSDILFFTTRGRVFQLKAYEIPAAVRTAKGQAIVNFLQLGSGEQVTSILPLDKIVNNEYLFFTTEKGLVKKVKISAFDNVRHSGLIAIKIKPEDKLIWAKPTSGKDEIQLVTAKGQAIRFRESGVRDMGRNATGVFGIRLKAGDSVVGMGVIKGDKEKQKKYQVLTIMENGFGKRTALGFYKVQGRGGSGIKTAKVTSKTGKLTNAFIVNIENMQDKDLIIISAKGQVIRLPFKSVSQSGRDTQGVRLMRFKEGSDKVAGVTWV